MKYYIPVSKALALFLYDFNDIMNSSKDELYFLLFFFYNVPIEEIPICNYFIGGTPGT